MNASNNNSRPSPAHVRFPRPRRMSAEQAHKAQFQDLVQRASQGDPNAVAAIYIAFRTVILEEAERVLGPHAADAEDVVQDFALLLLEGEMPYLPEFCAAGEWIRKTVRLLARRRRAELEKT